MYSLCHCTSLFPLTWIQNLCHPSKTNKLSVFLKKRIFVFKPSRTRSIASNPKKPPSQIPKKHSSFHCLLLASTRKKNFHAFFKKKFFSTPTGIRTHTKKNLGFPHSARQARPPPPIPPRRHALCFWLEFDHGLGPWPWPWTLTMAWMGLTNHNQS